MLQRRHFKAPKGKYRVICVDTFDGADWIHGDFDTEAEAITEAKEKGASAQMLKTHIYDCQGNHIFDAGTF